MSAPANISENRKLIDFKELKDTVKGEELEALTEHILRGLRYDPFRSGRGADGGKDLHCIQRVKSDLAEYSRTWLVQCKHFAHSGRGVNEDDIGSIVDKCRKHQADGFLVVTTTVLTNELVKTLEAIAAEKRDGIVTGYWDEHRLRELLLRPQLEEVLRRFLPESFARVQALQPVEILLEKLKAQGLDGDALTDIGQRITRALDEVREKKSPSLRIYPAASLNRDQLDKVTAFFSSGKVEETADALTILPYEEWSALISSFIAESPDHAEELLEHIATKSAEEDQRFTAVRRLISDFKYGLDNILPLIEGLHRDSVKLLADDLDLEELVSRKIESAVMNENPSSFDQLPAHLGISGVIVDDLEFDFEDGSTLTAHAQLSVETEVSPDGGEDYVPYSFPGTATVYINGSEDMTVESLSVDVESFFGDPEEEPEPPDED
ncbi:restriction endonuclease [Corallococcus llansteffanensis]|uniref:Restriction endonuclease type IV Mrr domain-containing protein n=1 Tax=Corallococcus llansteffanensis TaxID=2316731 RepID=A0A3A8P9Y2_9BACT|nr:restriction endonuclease [Corallococcus llansteffanensis]RKH53173.1 hypothetical protein D7V93_27145 [Corallococcus llansteffanensis]